MTDKLLVLRRTAAVMRELELEIADLEALLRERKQAVEVLKHQELPDLFMEAGVDTLALAAEGNFPPAEFRLKPYYRACIAASWPDDKRDAAFKHLEDEGFGDAIKRTYRVALGKVDRKEARLLEKLLKQEGYTYTANLDVPWQTLTALVREQFESGNKTLDLDKIGAQAGMVVTLK